jgi:hypothetical protein
VPGEAGGQIQGQPSQPAHRCQQRRDVGFTHAQPGDLGDPVQGQHHALPGRAALTAAPEHLAIIAAVTSGDAVIAEQTMRKHLTSVIGALHQLGTMGASPMAVAASWS